MKKIDSFEVIDHGIDHAQYFQGCGVAFTDFTDVATGAGESAAEAFEDALESLAQNDWDVSEIEKSDDGALFTSDKAKDATVHNYLVSQGENDDEREDGCELNYYVSIRCKGKRGGRMTAQTSTVRIDSIKVEWKADDDPDLSWLTQFDDSTDPEEQKYAAQDKARLADYGNGWWMLGCVAKAQVSYNCGQGSRRLEWLTSGGLWGIESDSSKDYLREVAQEQLNDLREHLEAFGIDWDEEKASEALEAQS